MELLKHSGTPIEDEAGLCNFPGLGSPYTAAATGEGCQLSMCNPSVPHQHHLSSAAASQHQPHSSISSQTEQMSCEGLWTQNLYKPSDYLNHLKSESYYNEGNSSGVDF